MRHAASGLLTLALAGVVAFVGAAHGAGAQGKRRAAPAAVESHKGDQPPDGDAATKVKVERGSGGRKVYKIEGEIVIEGKIQKPEAFYVLQKSSINYDWQDLKQEFVPRILESVTKAPF